MTVNALPVVELDSNHWYYDERLGELRHVDKPWENIKLDELSKESLDNVMAQTVEG